MLKLFNFIKSLTNNNKSTGVNWLLNTPYINY